MDLFTHALYPYLLGNYFRKRKEQVTAFVIGGIAPDVDIFLLWIQFIYPTFFLITHRGITHSIFFGFITGIIILYFASRSTFKKIVQRYIDFEPVFSRENVLYSFFGIIIHLVLDYSTTRGVPLLYPFDATRYSAELFFYTDIILTIVSLMIVIFIFKKHVHIRTITILLIILLIVTGGLGTLRFVEKKNTEKFLNEDDINLFPTISPFNWYAQKEYDDSIQIYEFNALDGTTIFNATFQRLNITSGNGGLEKAIRIADDTPQFKMFNWRAHSVAINASYSNGTWTLEYYDPVQKAQARDFSGRFGFARAMFGSLNINVTGDKAVVK